MTTLTQEEEKTRRQEAHTQKWTGPEASLPPGHHQTFGSDRIHPSSGVDLTPAEVAQMRQEQRGPDHHPWD